MQNTEIMYYYYNLKVCIEDHDLLDRHKQVDQCTWLIDASTCRSSLLRSLLLLTRTTN